MPFWKTIYMRLNVEWCSRARYEKAPGWGIFVHIPWKWQRFCTGVRGRDVQYSNWQYDGRYNADCSFLFPPATRERASAARVISLLATPYRGALHPRNLLQTSADVLWHSTHTQTHTHTHTHIVWNETELCGKLQLQTGLQKYVREVAIHPETNSKKRKLKNINYLEKLIYGIIVLKIQYRNCTPCPTIHKINKLGSIGQRRGSGKFSPLLHLFFVNSWMLSSDAVL
jgi:hypothetical protein